MQERSEWPWAVELSFGPQIWAEMMGIRLFSLDFFEMRKTLGFTLLWAVLYKKLSHPVLGNLRNLWIKFKGAQVWDFRHISLHQ